ncbi:UbiX family flavin prenyltransferase [Arsenophonus endosymbiont of Aphis craccivora]|uniref:UbiX family flavin prenyltransferase n=1 Tax=Arsenophonus endosymbiont of Aphis craccivora TaxID=1231049 RepID=UPI0015DD1F7C|nr:UbiX family flavin prenyltransferase [Arsenophonus endosymbiont of Aphis craccivora]QLK88074.1 UbiX family flavin prenyltransferase [Arsenophonus endosymbiont of Aphis craccivora]
MQRIIIGLTGASGAIYGIRLLEVLRSVAEVETHLIVSAAAKQTIALETSYRLRDVLAMADVVYEDRDIAAAISSGSFITSGMIIMPCSIKTLSGIANSYNDTLITRAADVVLKEKRKLILGVRETPLHLGHLRLMMNVIEIGAIIFPPMPAFYHQPETVQDIVDQTVNRILDQYGITLPQTLFTRWQGIK